MVTGAGVDLKALWQLVSPEPSEISLNLMAGLS